jgi:hypothetical protein
MLFGRCYVLMGLARIGRPDHPTEQVTENERE